MHRAHHARQHGAVADAGVEHAHRRRTRMDIGELHADALRDFPFLAAGVHEQQIFLPVVEEAEIALRVVARLAGGDRRRRRLDHGQRRGRRRVEQHAAARRRGVDVARHEAADALERIGGDAAAIAQAVGELAVIDRAAAEGGFGEAALAAEFADLLEDLIVHGGVSLSPLSRPAWSQGNQVRPLSSNGKFVLGKMGRMGGLYPIVDMPVLFGFRRELKKDVGTSYPT